MKLGLALSGGGIRGIAHAGVLKALEENNIKIEAATGYYIEKINVDYMILWLVVLLLRKKIRTKMFLSSNFLLKIVK